MLRLVTAPVAATSSSLEVLHTRTCRQRPGEAPTLARTKATGLRPAPMPVSPRLGCFMGSRRAAIAKGTRKATGKAPAGTSRQATASWGRTHATAQAEAGNALRTFVALVKASAETKVAQAATAVEVRPVRARALRSPAAATVGLRVSPLTCDANKVVLTRPVISNGMVVVMAFAATGLRPPYGDPHGAQRT